MLALTLALTLALAAGARAACYACVAGVCHSRQILLTGFRVTDQLAVDRVYNVLYTQLDHDQNIALFLDHREVRLLHTMRTSGMAVDQQTQTLYLGTKLIEKTFYKYHLSSNTTEAVSTNLNMKSDLMFYGLNDIHFISEGLSSVSLYDKAAGGIIRRYNQIKNYTISDFVIDMKGKIFFVSDDTVYVYDYDPINWETLPRVIAHKNHVLSADGYGAVYFGDASQKVIHTLDNATEKLKLYAYYKSGAVEDFVFDRDNNIVFRDADGGVARWVPAPARARCRVEPLNQDYIMWEITSQ